jgi:hypothetical protein
LRDSHDLHVIAVTSSTKIETKVRAVLSLLGRDGRNGKDQETKLPDGIQPLLVALVARTQAANKCISIAEIAKREIQKVGEKRWHQYTGYWSRMEEHHTANKTNTKNMSASQEEQEDLDDDSDAFEPMAIAEKRKFRSVPCLVIYLATAPVAILKETYG